MLTPAALTALPPVATSKGLPREGIKPLVPPIKCQGIKTKLVPFIGGSIRWTGDGRWVEPFLGSGVVAFSLAPERALLADSNPHLIRFYASLAAGEIDPATVRSFLEHEGRVLAEKGQVHYYYVRDRFNDLAEPLDFLFLNRACFNGLIRFNPKGDFNVPFNHKPQRFAPAYVTKVVNQVSRVREVMQGKSWEFRIADWQETVLSVEAADFVYADPPYIARFSDYFNSWDDSSSHELLAALERVDVTYAVSTWSHNDYRRNALLDQLPVGAEVRTIAHYYHLGATEALRNAMEEALIIRDIPDQERPAC